MKQIGWRVWNKRDVSNDGHIHHIQLVGMSEGLTESDKKAGFRQQPIYIDESETPNGQ